MDPRRQLEFQRAQLQLQRRPLLQHCGYNWNASIARGELLEDRQTGEPVLTAEVQLTFEGVYMFGKLPEEELRAFARLVHEYLGLAQPPVHVEVQLKERPRRRRRARAEMAPPAAPPATPEEKEKEAIKRRMMAGR